MKYFDHKETQGVHITASGTFVYVHRIGDTPYKLQGSRLIYTKKEKEPFYRRFIGPAVFHADAKSNGALLGILVLGEVGEVKYINKGVLDA